MPNMGAPISAVLIPALAAIIGPIVEPHAESFLTMKSCMGTPHLAATSLTIVALTVSVVYL